MQFENLVSSVIHTLDQVFELRWVKVSYKMTQTVSHAGTAKDLLLIFRTSRKIFLIVLRLVAMF